MWKLSGYRAYQEIKGGKPLHANNIFESRKSETGQAQEDFREFWHVGFEDVGSKLILSGH